MERFKVLDLFAGAGGLSCGFERNGNFDVKVAIENNKQAQDTYKRNFPDVVMLDDITEYNDFESFKKQYGEFQVIIGGPPCQGFSNANRHKSREINLNNLLVKKYVDFILGMKPEVFVMENVKNIQSDSKLFLLDRKEVENVALQPFCHDYAIEMTGLDLETISSFFQEEGARVVSSKVLEIKNFIKEYERKRIGNKETFVMDLVSLLEEEPSLRMLLVDDVEQYELPTRGHSCLYEKVNSLSIIYELLLHDTYIEEPESNDDGGYCIPVKSIKVIDYIQAYLSEEYDLAPCVYNAAQFGVPQTRERFVMFGAKKNQYEVDVMTPMITDSTEYASVRYAIEDLETYEPGYNLEDENNCIELPKKGSENDYSCRDSKHICNHCCTKSTPTALNRFSMIGEGQNFHSLPLAEQQMYADPSRTQNSIYRRLEYDKPSPTVTNVRKSMWIHPILNRAISIREAARLQSFPDSFIFEGNKDRQYQQIGNAVPPLFAEKIADHVVDIFSKKK